MPPTIAVDIDETLAWTVGHWVKQMQILFGNPEQLSVQEMVDKYRYTQNIPYWQSKEILAWAEEQKQSNRDQLDIPLIENSNTVLQEIHNIIPIKAYISIRPQRVFLGTKKWLEKYHFPQADIILRPDEIPHTEGNQWKASLLAKIFPSINIVMDDNPKRMEYFPSSYQGTILFFNATTSPRTDINIIPCKTWKDIQKTILSIKV